MSSSNLCEITFYVENDRNRPGTVDPQRDQFTIPVRRRYTPIVRSRQIRKKFFSNHQTLEVPEIMTERRRVQGQVIKSCELRKGYRRSAQVDVEEQKHFMLFEKQKENYNRVVRKYSVQGDALRKELDKFLELYA